MSRDGSNSSSNKMIEVEMKVTYDESTKAKILELATDKGSFQSFTDRYFDDDQYSLTTRDIWLRLRDETWELKCPVTKQLASMTSATSTSTTSYYDMDDKREIMNYLQHNGIIDPVTSDNVVDVDEYIDELLARLEAKSITPFAVIVTFRESFNIVYKGQQFRVDFDTTETSALKDYQLCEIELMVNDNESDRLIAQQQIQQLCQELGLIPPNKLYGKVLELIKRTRPDHWRALLDAKQKSVVATSSS
ncbi:hypothetical protein SAMD00019534_044010 [Acytostelium subglobosum LB1]|uniref:hypothetical protein n=1 Tax=Acytostelium subglobosum LB1 TaxID=1410327 RepID=UPI0006447D22|nr:hypothetical protein SAMD00019534_044010 [Acytostelium subglobosum LB1]GAM21226.1 hypothetical protein SAMD00019534_044010 [Acytostelium subglobosum LB1]|eukprot:XP_012755345.1 hypothetical protein SAMD00019534_044010 [Acytostelium subglobosum LB1]